MRLNQQQMADLLGVTKSVISKAEGGSQLSEAFAEKLADKIPQLAADVRAWIAGRRAVRSASKFQSIPLSPEKSAVLGSQAGHLFSAAMKALWDNAFGEAQRLLEEARQLVDRLGDDAQVAKADDLLGRCEMQRGNYASARSHFTQAHTRYTDLGLMPEMATALTNLGWNSRVVGQWSIATALFRSAKAIGEEISDGGIKSLALFNLALVQQNEGKYLAASELLQECLKIREETLQKRLEAGESVELSDKTTIAETKFNIGLTARLQSDLNGAFACYRDALLDLKELRRPALVATILINVADAAAAAGRAESAALVLSAAEGFRASKGIATIPVNLQTYERIHKEIRSALDAKALTAASERGAEMALDEAVEYALAEAIGDIP